MRFPIAKAVRRHLRAVANLGFSNALAYGILSRRLHGTPLGHAPITLRSRHCAHPLLCRPGTSDPHVFRQIFADREYRCLDKVEDPRLIVDCGANVGYSAAYFLSRFPHANLIAVEPDPGNFEILERNLAPFGRRARAMRSGVWSRSCGLVLSEEKYRDGREWTRQVRECRGGETAQMTAVDVGTLLETSGYSGISILKVDVEGAEAVIFSANVEPWIERVENIVIELHDDECERTFFRAIEGRGFDVSRCDELTVCKKRRFDRGWPKRD